MLTAASLDRAAQAAAVRIAHRSDAENRLARAWASSHDRKPANYLPLLVAVLREVGTERQVYYRQAERALESQSFQLLEAAVNAVQGELNRRRLAIAQVHAICPNLRRAA